MSLTQTIPPVIESLVDPSLQQTPPLSFIPFLKSSYGYGYPSKVNKPLCEDYRKGTCQLGAACPNQHYTPANERSGIGHLICKHYQRGLCKKGAACEFAHTFDLRGERECKEFSRFGICPQGDECTYIHLPPTSPLRVAPCPHYAQGFCPLGPWCSMRHVRHQRLCKFYIAGFCPNGRMGPPDRDGVVFCEHGAHPKFIPDLKKPEVRTVKSDKQLAAEQEEREEEFFAEEERRRERFERGEGGIGRGWGRRRRGMRGGTPWRGRGG